MAFLVDVDRSHAASEAERFKVGQDLIHVLIAADGIDLVLLQPDHRPASRSFSCRGMGLGKVLQRKRVFLQRNCPSGGRCGHGSFFLQLKGQFAATGGRT